MKIICIVGPTASGKTAAAVNLALHLNGEVVSCDSVQLYRGFDIGTAKPTMEERQGVPHHMLDISEPNDLWSAGRYAREARICIESLASRGTVPIITGGSGFYLRALIKGLIGLPPAPEDWEFLIIGLNPPRDELSHRIEQRAAAMLRNGLIEETCSLLQSGVPEDCAPMCSIGYLQARAVLSGQFTPEQALEEIALRTRQYAKRQRTWFIHQTDAVWYEYFSRNAVKTVENFLGM